jgi:hypothetical protein
MAFRTGQANFSKGEFAPELQGRIDVAMYQAGAARLRNVIIKKYGGVEKRPGTRIVAEVFDATKPVRLLPFQFSIEQTYVLEMGQGYMRPAALGGMVIEDKLTIQAATRTNPLQITAPYHGYSVGDWVFFGDDINGMVELRGRIAKVVSVADASHFSVDIDASAFSAYTSDSGGITRSDPPPAPPAPPPVPPVSPPPPPPPVGGGGGGGGHWNPDERIP